MEEKPPKKQRLELNAKESAKKFKQEFKKSTHTAIVAAFSFLIALTWRDLISGFVNKISSDDFLPAKLFVTITITLISVLGIMVTTKFLSNEKPK